MKQKVTWDFVYRRRRHWVSRYKISQGCSMCGYNTHPRALCFDHLGNDEKHDACKNVKGGNGHGGGFAHLYKKKYTVKELVNEIRKCDVVCMNCHMEITYPEQEEDDE